MYLADTFRCTAEAVRSSPLERVTSVMTFVDWVKWLVGFLLELRDSFFELCIFFHFYARHSLLFPDSSPFHRFLFK